ncbi:MAG: sulfatase-like hydrolase/transferase [Candidatus Latescibacterota bacterium]|nr:sulfatase-like hydrolase/transferase [Candidatus Latescibacterota bacterium]
MANGKNVLLITTDQQHWNTLGCINSEISTPNLDRLVSEGMLCNRAYCPNPTCTPTRASIITGLYPSQHGAWSLGTKLSEDVHVVGDDFCSAGYETALVGKAHFQPLQETDAYRSLEAYPKLQDLNFWREFSGPFYGFDTVRLARNHADEAHVGQHYAVWMEDKGFDWRDYFRPPTGTNTTQKHRWEVPEDYHYNTWIAEECCNFLELFERNDDSFFLWASFFDPHPPYLVPQPWDEMYDVENLTIPKVQIGEHDTNPPHFKLTQEENPDFSSWVESGHGIHGFHSHKREDLAKDVAVYYGMVSMMDKYVGQIVRRLDDLGMAEDTLVVFTSDHGHLFGQHGMTAKGPFHYEDLLRVPFITRCPGVIPAGERCNSLISLVDLPTTFLSWAEIEIPKSMVGRDQMPVWSKDVSSVRDDVVVENRQEYTTVHVKTLVTERFKLTVYLNQSYGELFDLLEDPQELRNLWDIAAHQGLKEALVNRLLFAEMEKEPIWMPRISGA